MDDMNLNLVEHLTPRVAQAIARAVRAMAANESWVVSSAAPHVGKSIAVHVPVLGHTLHLRWVVHATDVLQVSADQVGSATVQLSVAPTVYSSLAQLPFDIQRVMRHVQISGDAQLAEWVNRLVQQLRPDVWEDLSKIVGDVPSFYAQQSAKKIFNHLKSTVGALTQRTQHAMLDETPVLVRHVRLDGFAAEAQQLRYGADRLAQRIERLKLMQGVK